MLKKIGASSVIVKSGEQLENYTPSKIIIPGVGAFGKGMDNLNELGFTNVIHQKVVKDKIPCLGICLGMQLMTNGSEESSDSIGLGWFDCMTVKFKFDSPEYRVPHMGWNNLAKLSDNLLIKNIPKDHRFYFVHSYFVNLKNENEVVSYTNYGNNFPAIINRDNIFGVQFHPEKSYKYGKTILNNFINL